MSGWEKGDLALCVRGGPIQGPDDWDYPQSGKLYTVEAFGISEFDYKSMSALWLVDGPINNSGDKVWPTLRFIKVTPTKVMIKHERREGVPA